MVAPWDVSTMPMEYSISRFIRTMFCLSSGVGLRRMKQAIYLARHFDDVAKLSVGFCADVGFWCHLDAGCGTLLSQRDEWRIFSSDPR